MRSNRRRNWFIKRFALGLAITAFAAPVAQAKIDEGSSVQANGYQSFVTDFPSSQVNASDYGMPRAMPADYAVNRGDQIELVRSTAALDGRQLRGVRLRNASRAAGRLRAGER